MAKQLKARFTLQMVEQHATHKGAEDQDQCHVNAKFTAVTSNMEDCASWSKWTPSGELTMTITNPAALDVLHVGKDYFLDITPVE